jgi:hypothetical protein
MKILTLCAASTLILFSCNSADTNTAEKKDSVTATVTVAPDTSGWISLFDGKTTNGWHTYGKTTVGSSWKVSDGVIYLDTTKKADWQVKDGGDIVTDDEFENFHFQAEWKIAPGGNSGIIFLSKEDTVKYEHAWKTGPEMQVLDNDKHDDGKIPKHRAGDLYDLISCSKETVKPVGEWNLAEIIVKNGKLDLMLNGIVVVSTQLWDDGWKKLIAGSKFKDMPDFGTIKAGKISLQDHGNMVSFRNIRIKKL